MVGNLCVDTAVHSAPLSVGQVVLENGIGLNACFAYGVLEVLKEIPRDGGGNEKCPSRNKTDGYFADKEVFYM